MKTKIVIMLMPLLLCQCYKGQPQELNDLDERVDVAEQLDVLVDKLINERLDTEGVAKTSIDADSLTAMVWKIALQELEKEYGKMSEEMTLCYSHAGDMLIDGERPFSDCNCLAVTCYDKALTINKQLHGSNSVEVGRSYIYQAAAMGRDSYWAEQYIDSALTILIPKCGEISLEVASANEILGRAYWLSTHDSYRVATQIAASTQSDYYTEDDYNCIIPVLEQALSYYKKSYDILIKLGDEHINDAQGINEAIKNLEDELKENKDGLAYVKSH